MTETARPMELRDFFSAAEARIDRWRTLNRVAKALASPRPPAGTEDPKALLSDGFGYASQYTVPVLREIFTRQVGVQAAESASGDLGTLLAQMVRRWGPELDVYLTTDRDVAKLAGSAEAAPIRRIFYAAGQLGRRRVRRHQPGGSRHRPRVPRRLRGLQARAKALSA